MKAFFFFQHCRFWIRIKLKMTTKKIYIPINWLATRQFIFYFIFLQGKGISWQQCFPRVASGLLWQSKWDNIAVYEYCLYAGIICSELQRVFFIVSDTFSLHPNKGLIFVSSSYQVISLITTNYNRIDATEGYRLTDFSWHFRHIIL